jgi:hypothetical protein
MNLSVFHQGANKSGELWYSYWNAKKWDEDTKVQNVGIWNSPSAVVF